MNIETGMEEYEEKAMNTRLPERDCCDTHIREMHKETCPAQHFGYPGVGSARRGLTPSGEDLPFEMRSGSLLHIPDGAEFPRVGKVGRVCNILDEAQILYKQKADGYATVDGDTANVLGAKGQFADINRKFWRLKSMIWDEVVPMYPDAGMGESVEEILMDFIGHAALTIDFLREANKKEEGTL